MKQQRRTKAERLTQDLEAGRTIARFLEDPAVQNWFESEQRRITEQMVARPIADDDGRRADAVMLKSIRSLKASMSELAAASRRAQRTISEEKHGPY